MWLIEGKGQRGLLQRCLLIITKTEKSLIKCKQGDGKRSIESHIPWRTEARLPWGENWRTRCKPPSTPNPINRAAFGWSICAIIPSSDKKSPVLSSSSFSFFISFLTAISWPSDKHPLYTSACPPFPIKFSVKSPIHAQGNLKFLS